MTKGNAGQYNLLFLTLIVVLVIAVFSQSFSGDFVYDDRRQVLRNPLIQNPALYLQALTSDVWAFKGDGTVTASNYWRPTFTAWSILNYALFGADPFGWHLVNILLHIGVCLLAYLVLVKLSADKLLAFMITVLFAVHPVHVESVTWIAGSPDLLYAAFFLLSIWFALKHIDSGGLRDLWLSVAAFIPALGAKEVALFSIPIFVLIFWKKRGKRQPAFPFKLIAPFLVAGLIYFIFRWIVLGKLFFEVPGTSSAASIIWTAPPLFLFYLKQTVFPLTLGPNYPIRPEVTVSLLFLLSLGLSAIVAYGLIRFAKRSRLQLLGLGLFVFPLLPAFAVNSFPAEQIAHDRYLYLPLLGFLMLVMPEIRRLIGKASADNATKIMLTSTMAVALVFSYKTYSYSRIWLDELTLWRHSVLTDPGSSFNYLQLAAELAERGKTDESIEASNKSLEIGPHPLAYLARARNLIAQRRFERAVADLKIIVASPAEQVSAYTLYQAFEALSIAYNGMDQNEKAIDELKTARSRLPFYSVSITSNLATILYQEGKKEEALRELEAVRTKAAVEMLPESKWAVYRLGMLHAEMGEKQKAIDALGEFLRLTSDFSDKKTIDFRNQANEMLKQIR